MKISPDASSPLLPLLPPLPLPLALMRPQPAAMREPRAMSSTREHTHTYAQGKHIHTRIHTHTRTHTTMHTRIHTRTHAHIHTKALTSCLGCRSRPGIFYNTLNNFKSSSGEPWKILQAVLGPPDSFGHPVYYPGLHLQALRARSAV